jgi:hypothetical protein
MLQRKQQLINQWHSQWDDRANIFHPTPFFELLISVDLFCVVDFARKTIVNITLNSTSSKHLSHIIFCKNEVPYKIVINSMKILKPLNKTLEHLPKAGLRGVASPPPFRRIQVSPHSLTKKI